MKTARKNEPVHRDWKTLYYVKSLSMIACCGHSSGKSFHTISKVTVPDLSRFHYIYTFPLMNIRI